jgi:hypothetical protein
MSDIDKLLEAARKHYERADLYRHLGQDSDSITKAQVALDTAEDAMQALSHYEKAGIGSDIGEKYLRLYGFLEAIYLQQDAMAELHRIFVGKLAEPAASSAWSQLRDLRNLTAAHPIEKGLRNEPRKRTFITQVSLESDGFDFQVWHQETSEISFERADLSALYSAYKEEAAWILERIVAELTVAPDFVP